jgi:3-dehydroquinate synthase
MIRISLTSTPPSRSTDVFIAPEILSKADFWLNQTPPSSCAVIITDSIVAPLYARILQNSLKQTGLDSEIFEFPAGEPSKSFRTATQIYTFLAQQKLGRDGLIVALGGGVVGDVAGFVAGTWMRGVRWINCPTSMEADVDACLGGKTAVNLPDGKNLVGVFHDPSAVVIDPHCLRTLPDREIRAGLAEAIKHALLQSVRELDWLETHINKILSLDPEILVQLIERNLRFKGRVAAEDPQDKLDRRIILNFGHTIGHAIEVCFEGTLRHGECISLGMLAACRISHRVGLLAADEVRRVHNLLRAAGLPTRLEHPVEQNKFLSAMKLDKKNAAGKSRFVLLKGIGNPVIHDDVSADFVAEAFASLC